MTLAGALSPLLLLAVASTGAADPTTGIPGAALNVGPDVVGASASGSATAVGEEDGLPAAAANTANAAIHDPSTTRTATTHAAASATSSDAVSYAFDYIKNARDRTAPFVRTAALTASESTADALLHARVQVRQVTDQFRPMMNLVKTDAVTAWQEARGASRRTFATLASGIQGSASFATEAFAVALDAAHPKAAMAAGALTSLARTAAESASSAVEAIERSVGWAEAPGPNAAAVLRGSGGVDDGDAAAAPIAAQGGTERVVQRRDAAAVPSRARDRVELGGGSNEGKTSIPLASSLSSVPAAALLLACVAFFLAASFVAARRIRSSDDAPVGGEFVGEEEEEEETMVFEAAGKHVADFCLFADEEEREDRQRPEHTDQGESQNLDGFNGQQRVKAALLAPPRTKSMSGRNEGHDGASPVAKRRPSQGSYDEEEAKGRDLGKGDNGKLLQQDGKGDRDEEEEDEGKEDAEDVSCCPNLSQLLVAYGGAASLAPPAVPAAAAPVVTLPPIPEPIIVKESSKDSKEAASSSSIVVEPCRPSRKQVHSPQEEVRRRTPAAVVERVEPGAVDATPCRTARSNVVRERRQRPHHESEGSRGGIAEGSAKRIIAASVLLAVLLIVFSAFVLRLSTTGAGSTERAAAEDCCGPIEDVDTNSMEGAWSVEL